MGPRRDHAPKFGSRFSNFVRAVRRLLRDSQSLGISSRRRRNTSSVLGGAAEVSELRTLLSSDGLIAIPAEDVPVTEEGNTATEFDSAEFLTPENTSTENFNPDFCDSETSDPDASDPGSSESEDLTGDLTELSPGSTGKSSTPSRTNQGGTLSQDSLSSSDPLADTDTGYWGDQSGSDDLAQSDDLSESSNPFTQTDSEILSDLLSNSVGNRQDSFGFAFGAVIGEGFAEALTGDSLPAADSTTDPTLSNSGSGSDGTSTDVVQRIPENQAVRQEWGNNRAGVVDIAVAASQPSYVGGVQGHAEGQTGNIRRIADRGILTGSGRPSQIAHAMISGVEWETLVDRIWSDDSWVRSVHLMSVSEAGSDSGESAHQILVLTASDVTDRLSNQKEKDVVVRQGLAGEGQTVGHRRTRIVQPDRKSVVQTADDPGMTDPEEQPDSPRLSALERLEFDQIPRGPPNSTASDRLGTFTDIPIQLHRLRYSIAPRGPSLISNSQNCFQEMSFAGPG